MPRSPPRGSPLVSVFAVGFILASGCGGKLQGGALAAIADDASARAADDAAGGAPVAGSKSDDAAAPSNAVFDDASVVFFQSGDASDVGASSVDGGIDPNGPCPASPGRWACPVEGARLCGLACSLQCSCTDGFWLCRLPPC